MHIWKTCCSEAAGRVRRALLAALLALGWPLAGMAQLALELRLASATALAYESVFATVTLRNNSARALRFGAGPDDARIRFAIELGHGRLIAPTEKGLLLDEVELAPGEARSWEFNLPRLYALGERGRYKLQAVVEWGGVSYGSAPAYLELVKGFELARLRAGVPDDPDASRTYVLEYITKDNSEENLCLRIEDEKARELYGVFNLGRVVRVRPPDLQVDESGNVHVLFQTPGMGYVHAAFTPYGTALAARNYPGGNRMVEMNRLPNGRVAVTSAEGKPAPKSGAEGPETLPPMEDGPVTEVKKTVGGLFGRFNK